MSEGHLAEVGESGRRCLDQTQERLPTHPGADYERNGGEQHLGTDAAQVDLRRREKLFIDDLLKGDRNDDLDGGSNRGHRHGDAQSASEYRCFFEGHPQDSECPVFLCDLLGNGAHRESPVGDRSASAATLRASSSYACTSSA